MWGQFLRRELQHHAAFRQSVATNAVPLVAERLKHPHPVAAYLPHRLGGQTEAGSEEQSSEAAHNGLAVNGGGAACD